MNEGRKIREYIKNKRKRERERKKRWRVEAEDVSVTRHSLPSTEIIISTRADKRTPTRS